MEASHNSSSTFGTLQSKCSLGRLRYREEHTSNTLRVRVDYHKKPNTTPEYDHAANPKHSIDYGEVVVKAREDDWLKNGVKEAIYIKRKGSDLNKDKG